MKIAANEKIMRKFDRVDLIMAPTTIQDYESIYLTEEQRRSFPNGTHMILSTFLSQEILQSNDLHGNVDHPIGV